MSGKVIKWMMKYISGPTAWTMVFSMSYEILGECVSEWRLTEERGKTRGAMGLAKEECHHWEWGW